MDNSTEADVNPNAVGQGSSFSNFSGACKQATTTASYQFSGLGSQDLLVIEICAGTARLTKTVRARGIRGLAVDKSKNRTCGTDIMVLDLTVEHDLNLLMQIISAEAARIILVFISPPCGTASKARERPIKTSLLFGRKQPLPLRSAERPDQKDGLSGLDKFKTETANQLYEAVRKLVMHCNALGLWVLVENPRNSLYWSTSFAQAYINAIVTFWIDFHNCAHGGQRDKLTRLWSNKNWGQELQLFCDGQHTHASWRPRIINNRLNFPTAEEAAYPWLFCERVVNIVEQVAQSFGSKVPSTLKEQVESGHLPNFQRYVFDALPRSAKLRPLVPEYGRFFTLGMNPQNPQFADTILKKLPKGAKILSRQLVRWDNFRDEMVDKLEMDSWPSLKPDDAMNAIDTVEVCKFGVPFDPVDFVCKAVEAGHPRDLLAQVSDLIQDTVVANFHKPPHLLASERALFLKKYSNLAVEMKAEELKLRYHMPPHIRELMSGKRLALWGKMLEDLNYPDKTLIHDISQGFPLSGWMPASGVFPACVRQPVLTMEALLEGLSSFNDKVRSQMSMRQDATLEEETWAETLKELEQGWIWEDPDQSWCGKCVARRFGIHQGDKTRVIDDCSVCGLNQTVGLREKFVLQSIDQMCAMLCWSLRRAGGAGHPPVVGRTFDLKSAYKQFGLSVADRNLLRIAVTDPARDKPVLVGLNSLPFGGVGSVAGFLRVSLATWFTGMAGLKICWTGYFDDFSAVSRPELQKSTTWSIESLFDLIGLDFAREGPKAPDFGHVFKMLGVQIDATEAASGAFSVGHTESRRQEIVKIFDAAIETGLLSSKVAESIRGRMVFYECFAAGRTTNLLLKEFGKMCRSDRAVDELTAEDLVILVALRGRVAHAKPISISAAFMDTWYIFTDGACETSDDDTKTGGVGGVLVSSSGQYIQHFGAKLPQDWMDYFLTHSRHPIHEIEVLPVLISFYVWRKFISFSQVLHYTDNDSCRYALMKGAGETPVAKCLVSSIMEQEHLMQTKSWYGRVPSHSNPSDDPSRGSCESLAAFGSIGIDVPWSELLEILPTL